VCACVHVCACLRVCACVPMCACVRVHSSCQWVKWAGDHGPGHALCRWMHACYKPNCTPCTHMLGTTKACCMCARHTLHSHARHPLHTRARHSAGTQHACCGRCTLGTAYAHLTPSGLPCSHTRVLGRDPRCSERKKRGLTAYMLRAHCMRAHCMLTACSLHAHCIHAAGSLHTCCGHCTLDTAHARMAEPQKAQKAVRAQRTQRNGMAEALWPLRRLMRSAHINKQERASTKQRKTRRRPSLLSQPLAVLPSSRPAACTLCLPPSQCRAITEHAAQAVLPEDAQAQCQGATAKQRSHGASEHNVPVPRQRNATAGHMRAQPRHVSAKAVLSQDAHAGAASACLCKSGAPTGRARGRSLGMSLQKRCSHRMRTRAQPRHVAAKAVLPQDAHAGAASPCPCETAPGAAPAAQRPSAAPATPASGTG